MSYFVLRSATASDAVNCHRVESASWVGDGLATLDDFEQWIRLNPNNFIICEMNDEFAGFVHFGHSNDDFISEEGFKVQCGQVTTAPYAHIRSVAVDTVSHDHCSMGMLIGCLEEHFQKLNKKGIHLRCRDAYVDRFRAEGFRYIQAMASDDISTWHEMGLHLSW
ncbi:hypothetical protein PS838_05974 [Pseudomonas fluorescens]|nr:hypothetical protein PS838_05974 [Pseudomonas fluorescens]